MGKRLIDLTEDRLVIQRDIPSVRSSDRVPNFFHLHFDFVTILLQAVSFLDKLEGGFEQSGAKREDIGSRGGNGGGLAFWNW